MRVPVLVLPLLLLFPMNAVAQGFALVGELETDLDLDGLIDFPRGTTVVAGQDFGIGIFYTVGTSTINPEEYPAGELLFTFGDATFLRVFPQNLPPGSECVAETASTGDNLLRCSWPSGETTAYTAGVPVDLIAPQVSSDTPLTITASIEPYDAYPGCPVCAQMIEHTLIVQSNGGGSDGADLAVSITPPATPPAVGEEFGFQVHVVNNGPDFSLDNNVDITFDAALQVLSGSSSQGSCNTTSQQRLFCVLGSMGEGQEATITVRARGHEVGSFDVTANVEGSEPDPNSTNNIDEEPITIEEATTAADLDVDLLAEGEDESSFLVGGVFDYVIRVHNKGPDASANVRLGFHLPKREPADPADPLALAVSVLGFSPEGIDCIAPNDVNCLLGELEAYETVTIRVTVMVLEASTLAARVIVLSDTPDPDSSNNEDDVVPNPLLPDLHIEKAGPAKLFVGQTFDYLLTVTNEGEGDAPETVVTDLLPPFVTYVAATASQGTCTAAGSPGAEKVTCSLGTLAAGSPPATITVTVKAVEATEITFNEASVESALPDEDPTDNKAEVFSSIEVGGADLWITKEVVDYRVSVGQEFTYRLTIGNSGPDLAENVVVKDLLAELITLADTGTQPVTTTKGVCTGDREIVCTIGGLAVEERVEVVVAATARVDGVAYNTAGVTSDTFDPDPEDNTADASQYVLPRTTGDNPSGGDDRDPVSTFSGELYFSEAPDLYLGGPLPLFFGRYYASFLSQANGLDHALGLNWTHNYDWRLLAATDSLVAVLSPQGRYIPFLREADAWVLDRFLDRDYQLVQDGDLFRFGDPRTVRIYTFDRQGRLIEIADGPGNRQRLSYQDDRLVAVEDDLGQALTLHYDGQGHLVSVSDGTRVVRFSHDDQLLQAVTDVQGLETTFDYDVNHARPGLLTAKVLPEGNAHYRQRYGEHGRVLEQTDALGHTYHFSYEGDTTIVTDPTGRAKVHVHDPSGRLLSHQDELGQTIRHDYDERGRLEQVTDRLGARQHYRYDPVSGRIASLTEADGGTVSVSYAPRSVNGITFYDPVAVTNADGATVRFAYDEAGNLLRVIDPSGLEHRYSYNERGQPLTVTNVYGGVSRLVYNTDATLASVIDPFGNSTSFDYDAFQNLSAIRWPDGSSRHYRYDVQDRLESLTDERDFTTHFAYDANGNLVQVTDPLGQTFTYRYDAMDRIVELRDAMGHSYRANYDILERPEAFSDPTGATEQVHYDAAGRVTGMTAPSGEHWSMSYDAEAIPTSMTQPWGATYTYTSNEMGWMTQVRNPAGQTVDVDYDEMGRITYLRGPEGHTTMYHYDERGLMTEVLAPEGASVTYDRDALGTLTGATAPGGGVWQFTRDVLGRVTATTDPVGRQTHLDYDARHRLTQVQFPGGLGTLQVDYDGANNPTQVSYSDGLVIRYRYDAVGLVEAVEQDTLVTSFERDANGRITRSNGLAYTWDERGLLTGLGLPPGQVHYGYDEGGRPVQVTDWLGGETHLSYDAAGQLSEVRRPNGITTSYSYDAEGRIRSIKEEDEEGAVLAVLELERDARANVVRSRREGPLGPAWEGAKVSFTYDGAGQIEGFGHDGLGRRMQDATRSYEWDLASRLISWSDGTQQVRYGYDGLGYRVTRETVEGTERYVWNYGLERPSVSVVEQEGQALRYEVHLPDGTLLYSMLAGDGARRYYHFDELGNTVFVSDDAGDVIGAYVYDPYGRIMAEEGALDNPYTYQGQFGVMREAGTGLYYMRARYYDSATGRFLSRDPYRSFTVRRVNPYQYAVGNPLRYVDPSGLREEVDGTPAEWSPFNELVDFIGTARRYVSYGIGRYKDYLDIRRIEVPKRLTNFSNTLKYGGYFFTFWNEVKQSFTLENVIQGVSQAASSGAVEAILAKSPPGRVVSIISEGADLVLGAVGFPALKIKEPLFNVPRLVLAADMDIAREAIDNRSMLYRVLPSRYRIFVLPLFQLDENPLRRPGVEGTDIERTYLGRQIRKIGRQQNVIRLLSTDDFYANLTGPIFSWWEGVEGNPYRRSRRSADTRSNR